MRRNPPGRAVRPPGSTHSCNSNVHRIARPNYSPAELRNRTAGGNSGKFRAVAREDLRKLVYDGQQRRVRPEGENLLRQGWSK